MLTNKVNHRISRFVAILVLSTFFVAGTSGSVTAEPTEERPIGINGINIPTLMSFYDRTQQLPGVSDMPSAPPFRTIRTVVLDPGHGGENDGAIGVAHRYEKRLTLQLAFDLRDALRRAHPEVNVLLTRYEDRTMKLSERVAYANEQKADIFISLHYNAAPHNRALGFEAYTLAADAQKANCKDPLHSMTCADQRIGSEELGNLVIEAYQTYHPDMINRGLKQANFGVLRGAKMPAIVVESGFLTHPVEGMEIVKESNRRETVKALVSAIEKFDATNDVLPEQVGKQPVE